MPVGPLLTIQSRAHPYTVDVAPSFTAAVKTLAASDAAFVLVDESVRRLYPKVFAPIRADRLLEARATEKNKSYGAVAPLFRTLLDRGFKRGGSLVVVGGGVVQDIGCFIASVIFRGVRWGLIPTTLLAQCDSCIGSKSSINVGPFKNMIGTFYPPHQVFLALDVLETLSRDEVRSGLGEVIKLHLIEGEAAFDAIRPWLARYENDPSAIRELVVSSLRIKQHFIEEDEFDRGIRNQLNYGHTFGHAYESATRYGLPHGIAVTLGIVTASFVAERLGRCPAGSAAAVKDILRPFYQPFDRVLRGASLDGIVKAISHDKKTTADQVTCIIPRATGGVESVPLSIAADLRPLVEEFLHTL